MYITQHFYYLAAVPNYFMAQESVSKQDESNAIGL